jgi:hypothetical protein
MAELYLFHPVYKQGKTIESLLVSVSKTAIRSLSRIAQMGIAKPASAETLSPSVTATNLILSPRPHELRALPVTSSPCGAHPRGDSILHFGIRPIPHHYFTVQS